MKKEWSAEWACSTQPRKQRKYRHNAPQHVRRKFLSAHLSPQLRERHSKRSIILRKGDQVQVMRGASKGLRGAVDRVDTEKGRAYVEGVKAKKADGSEVLRSVNASNLMVISLNLDDKKRMNVFARKDERDSGSGKGPAGRVFRKGGAKPARDATRRAAEREKNKSRGGDGA